MTNPDTIYIKELKVDCIIGIFKRERVKKQRVSIDLELPTDARNAAALDPSTRGSTSSPLTQGDAKLATNASVDYKRVAKSVLTLAEKSKFLLVESLAEGVADMLLKTFKLPWVKVTVWKPGAVRFSKNVGIEVIRRRESAGTAYVSFGSNVRQKKSAQMARQALERAFDVSAVSSVYESDAVGPAKGKFWNFVAEIRTDAPLETLKNRLRKIEGDLGRVRTKDKFAPRTADLDVVFYGKEIHPDWDQPHVLLPMAEIVPGFRHPASGKTIIEIIGDQIVGKPFKRIRDLKS